MTTKIEQYDALILGSGEAGKYIGWHLASAGKRTAVIERKYLGGACPNMACLPSKNIIQGAKVASFFQKSEEFGMMKDHWNVSMPAVRARKQAMVEDLREMHLGNFAKSGAEIVMGSGRFVGDKTIEVSLQDGGVRLLRGERVFLNTGTRATIDDVPGLAESKPMTHIEALELDIVPEHLLILGGGYVGLEFAQAMRRFGSRVTVIERNARLVHREDQDVSDALHELFEAEGIEVVTNAQVVRVTGQSGTRINMQISQGGSEVSLEGSHVLVATGRTPNTEGIGLELAGIATAKNGYIQVNERLETTAPGVWALGDCAGSPHFTHIAFSDFRIVAANLAGGNRTTTERQVPSCLFTDPELARIGLNETAAKQQGIPYRLAKVPMKSTLRTRAIAETRGFMKVLVSTTDDRILGFTGFGVSTGETMAAVQVAMAASLPYTILRDMVLTHPTFTEGLIPLFSAVPATKS